MPTSNQTLKQSGSFGEVGPVSKQSWKGTAWQQVW